MMEKVRVFGTKLETQQRERLIRDGLGCQGNLDNCKVSVKNGSKYVKVDVGSSGKYMIDMEGNIYGIKGYGVVNKQHQYGTLDTINNYYWGEYKPIKLNG